MAKNTNGPAVTPDPEMLAAAEAKAKAEAERLAAEEAARVAAAEPKLVRMVRDEPVHAGGPTSADVHPDEVNHFIAGGWTVEK